jgi:hypothetical protein
MKPLKRIKATSKINDKVVLLYYESIAQARRHNPAFVDFEYI